MILEDKLLMRTSSQQGLILHSATENYINFEIISQRDNICDRMSDTRIEITDLSTGQERNHDVSFSLGKKAYQQNFFFWYAGRTKLAT